jgi:hypothetical protein
MDTGDMGNQPAFEQPAAEQIDLTQQTDVQETTGQGSASGMLRASHSDTATASRRTTGVPIPDSETPAPVSASSSRSTISASSHRRSHASRDSQQSSSAADDTHKRGKSSDLSSDESVKLIDVRHPNKMRLLSSKAKQTGAKAAKAAETRERKRAEEALNAANASASEALAPSQTSQSEADTSAAEPSRTGIAAQSAVDSEYYAMMARKARREELKRLRKEKKLQKQAEEEERRRQNPPQVPPTAPVPSDFQIPKDPNASASKAPPKKPKAPSVPSKKSKRNADEPASDPSASASATASGVTSADTSAGETPSQPMQTSESVSQPAVTKIVINFIELATNLEELYNEGYNPMTHTSIYNLIQKSS